MYKVEGNKITLTRGDSLFLAVGITRNGEAYTPQEGDVVRFYLKHDKMKWDNTDFQDEEPVVTKTIPNDTMVLHLLPSDTNELEFGVYKYDIEITFADGEVSTFINDESFRLAREVG